jgi:hypothetical protein
VTIVAPTAVSSPARSRSPLEKERLVTSTTADPVVAAGGMEQKVVLYVQEVNR